MQIAGTDTFLERKQVLAWWVSQHTTVSRGWVSQRLGMGDESRVTQSIRTVKQNRSGHIRKLRERLERLRQLKAQVK